MPPNDAVDNDEPDSPECFKCGVSIHVEYPNEWEHGWLCWECQHKEIASLRTRLAAMTAITHRALARVQHRPHCRQSMTSIYGRDDCDCGIKELMADFAALQAESETNPTRDQVIATAREKTGDVIHYWNGSQSVAVPVTRWDVIYEHGRYRLRAEPHTPEQEAAVKRDFASGKVYSYEDCVWSISAPSLAELDERLRNCNLPQRDAAKAKESWLNGWVRNGEFTLVGAVPCCAGCGKGFGVTCVVFDSPMPDKDPDWPFEESTCPLCELRNRIPTPKPLKD